MWNDICLEGTTEDLLADLDENETPRLPQAGEWVKSDTVDFSLL